MKRKATLCFLMVILIMTWVSTAYSVTIFPLEGQESSYFPYTKADELRYQAIYEGALSSATEGQIKGWEYEVQFNIDYFAKLKGKDLSTYPGVFAVPGEDAISKGTAIYTVYSAMEHLFNYTGEMLMMFYPVCQYDVKDSENPYWYIDYDPINRTGVQGLYSFIVYVNASDGLVIKITDNTGDAVG
jgi:hypothetical protein